MRKILFRNRKNKIFALRIRPELPKSTALFQARVRLVSMSVAGNKTGSGFFDLHILSNLIF
ncbi:Uncharacterized protein dnm_094160 [Desulfonema magnum]|uniref:Uncharacterized protein n=1 Tax=Desulfonema magnum TaxID=45655 RepID=A0A975GTP4_9BACT|nr:Uncharacterized protein dnm_094160 [Desulfonema magnum]